MATVIGSELYDENYRLRTFINKWKSTVIQPETLAKEGFFYKDGIDNVECAFCKLGLNEFEENDDIQALHREYSPNCSFIKNRNRASGPLNGEDSCGFEIKNNNNNTQPLNRGYTYGWYKNLQTRINTFKEWPISMTQRPEELASAGFFYTGTSDKCVCFYCGLGLKKWESGDDPFVEHAKYAPDCEYLVAKKGEKFIEKCKINKNSTEEQQTTTTTAAPEDEEDEEANHRHEDECETYENETYNTSSPLCKICYRELANMAVMPCGHVFCVDCVTQLKNCAICRKHIETVSKIYL